MIADRGVSASLVRATSWDGGGASRAVSASGGRDPPVLGGRTHPSPPPPRLLAPAARGPRRCRVPPRPR
eukprot:4905405-Pleurochrysis_carterae.AAC.1